jgi:ribosomal-protein-alanine N-acetyltransferase
MLPDGIETKRLRLRPFAFGDVEDILVYATDPKWARYLPVPQPYKRVHAEQFIASQLLLDQEVHQSWAIELGGIVIGGINIRFDFDNYLGEMGYSIGPAQWGQGLATEAAGAVIDAAFKSYRELNRVRAMADARNLASLRVMEKVGMTREGILLQNRWVRGEPVDEVWYGLLRSTWREK